MKTFTKGTAFILAVFTVAALSSCGKKNENEHTKTGTLTVDCTRVSAELDSEILSAESDGYILRDKEVGFDEGDTVEDVLKDTLTSDRIAFDISDGYVSGIGGVNTGDFGELSGWLYYVNGEMPSVGVGEYELSGGEDIKLVYYADYNEAFEADGAAG